jgi:adenosylhomocysteine nucleosidase
VSESSADITAGVVAIVAAMPEEVAPLRARMGATVRSQRGGLVIERGEIAGRPVALGVTGDGARNARSGAEALLAGSGARALLVLGVSGALSPELATADLIVASRVTEEDGRALDADPAQVAEAARATGGRQAVVMSARKIADTADEKRRLAARAGAGLAVCDLESASYVAAAGTAGIPWMVLRAISDTAGETLPPLLNRSMDAGGAVSRGRVLRGLISDPGALPLLLTLRRRVGQCAEVLARAAEATLPTCLTAKGLS